MKQEFLSSEPVQEQGISAKCEEMGGTDLIIVYNSGKFRMSGIGSTAGCLPIGDCKYH